MQCGPLFFLLGIYLFYLGLKYPWVMVSSAVIFGVSMSAYHSERILTPLVVVFLTWRYRRTLFKQSFRLPLVMSFLTGFLTVLPLLSVVTTPGFLSRAASLNIISQAGRRPPGYLSGFTGLAGSIVNSPLWLTPREFLSLYVSYFSPRNMFDLGDYGPRSSFPSLATFYVWQFPFYLLGLYFLFKNRVLGELRSLTIFLLIVSPIPAAMTGDPYTTIRALPLVVPQLIVVALGIAFLFYYLRSGFRIIYFLFLGVLCIYSLLTLYGSAFILNEYFRAKEWDYGWEQVVKIVNGTDRSLPVVVDNVRGENYIELLFFLKFDPARYQRENFEVPLAEYYTNLGRNPIKKIGRITTRPIIWEKDLMVDQILVGDELAISKQQIDENKLALVKEVRYPDRKVAFRIVRTNLEYQLRKRQGDVLTGGR